MGTPRRIGIMGGSFDPIHLGHLVTAEQARADLDIDEVIFIPAGQPWQKERRVTPAEHRYLMTVLATAANPAFSVSRIEIDRDGPTYTVDTLRMLRDATVADTGTGIPDRELSHLFCLERYDLGPVVLHLLQVVHACNAPGHGNKRITGSRYRVFPEIPVCNPGNGLLLIPRRKVRASFYKCRNQALLLNPRTCRNDSRSRSRDDHDTV
jgi:cytidyltransferase-like protein